MKNLNNLFLISGLAGLSLLNGGCKKLSVEEYIKQNQKVYKAFNEFVKEKGEKNEKYKTLVYAEKNFVGVYSETAIVTHIKAKGKWAYFCDFYNNGLGSLVYYGKSEENFLVNLEYLPTNKQLLVTQKYTEILKEKMREKGQKQIKIMEQENEKLK